MAVLKNTFIINGVSRMLICEEQEKLADVLRRNGLSSVKLGCGTGQCGSCTVLLNGVPTRSCLVRMGKLKPFDRIETVEGLGVASNLHPLQRAWIACGAVQCGFCTPGLIMSAKGLLDQNPSPTREEVRAWFTRHNNICRCTGYKPIVDAVMAAAEVLRGEKSADEAFPAVDSGSLYGSRAPRPDAVGKVLGQTDYGDDIGLKMPPSTLHLAVVWPETGHEEILGIDTAEAEAMPGVVRVLTAADVPGKNQIGPLLSFERSYTDLYVQPVLADKKVYRKGDPIALVAAATAEQAHAAAARVKVRSKPLPVYETSLEAVRGDAMRIHEESPNQFFVQPVVKGENTDRIIKDSEYVVSGSFYSSRQPHLSLEPWAIQSFYDEEGRLAVVFKSQWLYFARDMISVALGMDKDKIRIIESPTGASFGYAVTAEAAVLPALAACVLKQPVTMTLSWEETIRFTGKRAAAYTNARMACDRSGRITALEYDMLMDHGGHARSGGNVEIKACRFSGYPYRVDHIRGLVRAAFSNNAFCTTYRGFGSPQAFTVSEALVDMLAEKAGIDPFEFRVLNAAKPGDTTPNQFPYTPCAIGGVLELLRPCYEKALAWKKEPAPPGKRRGVGVSCGGYHVSSASDRCEVILELNEENGVTAKNSWEAQGQGAYIGALTVTLEALKPLGLKPEQIRLDLNDTGSCPEGGPAGGSRSHYMMGNATIDAARKLLRAMRKPDGSYRSYEEMKAEGIETVYHGVYSTAGMYQAIDPNRGAGEGKADQNYTAYVACVEVDEKTGKTEVVRVSCAADVGVIGNRAAVDGQALGGLAHSIGYALSEEYSDLGKKYATMLGCGIERCSDVPDEVELFYQETPREHGPFGSGGAAEAFQSNAHMSVINAIHDAVGVRIFALPATPDKVKAAMEAKRSGQETEAEPYWLGSSFEEDMEEIIRHPIQGMGADGEPV